MAGTRPLRSIELAFLVVLILLHIGLAIFSSSQTNDDAFISFRYSRNLVDGNGLVFNPGERVEGYTNFLWVMIIALFMPFSDPVLISKILGVLCNLTLIYTLWLFCRRYQGWLIWIAPLYVTLDPSVLRWGTRGLETSLFGMLLWLGIYLAITPKDDLSTQNKTSSRSIGAGIVTALATLARPEGFIVAVIVSAARIVGLTKIGYYRENIYHGNDQVDGSNSTAGYLLKYWIGYCAILVPYLAWKLFYFGGILPNTFYAKTSGGAFKIWRGLAYLTSGWGWPELLLGLTVLAAVVSRRSSLAKRTISFMALVFIVYVVWVGGDSLGPDRFLAPIVPLLIITAALVLTDWTGGITQKENVKSSGKAKAFVACGVLCAMLLGNASQLRNLVGSDKVYSAEKEADHPRTRMGRCLAEHAAKDDSVATSLIGRMPYYSGLVTLDMFGLIDPHIARKQSSQAGSGAAGHEKTDIDYILSREPDWIVANELVVAPPKEREWLSALRRKISGDPPASQMRLLTPPFDGYTRTEVRCSDFKGRLWKRDNAPERINNILMAK